MSPKEFVARASLGVSAAILVFTAVMIALAFRLELYGQVVFGFFVGALNIVNIHLAKDIIHLAKDIIQQAEQERKKKNVSV